MKILTLDSTSLKGIGTFGIIRYQGDILCHTVEREWLDNKPSISCVSGGTYQLLPIHSPTFGDTFVLVNPDLGVTHMGPSQRTHCLIHAANFPHEVQGCIAPGLAFHPSQWGVLDSRKAVSIVLELLGREPATLIINRNSVR